MFVSLNIDTPKIEPGVKAGIKKSLRFGKVSRPGK
jgi:hypothetical protein